MYQGNYKDDQREGYGEMYWTDGTVYKGEWRKGCQHGFGKMLQPDGYMFEGYFDMNVFKGPVAPENLYNEEIVEELKEPSEVSEFEPPDVIPEVTI